VLHVRSLKNTESVLLAGEHGQSDTRVIDQQGQYLCITENSVLSKVSDARVLDLAIQWA
jgi:hypothetical protein